MTQAFNLSSASLGPRAEKPRTAGAKLLSFEVGGQVLALPVQDVAEIVFVASLSCAPGAPGILAGFLNFEGTAIPVLRTARFFEVRDVTLGSFTPLILVRHGGERFGLLVDKVHQIVSVPQSSVFQLPPPGLTLSAVRLDEIIVPIVSIADLLLEQERLRITELRRAHQSRLQEIQEAAISCR